MRLNLGMPRRSLLAPGVPPSHGTSVPCYTPAALASWPLVIHNSIRNDASHCFGNWTRESVLVRPHECSMWHHGPVPIPWNFLQFLCSCFHSQQPLPLFVQRQTSLEHQRSFAGGVENESAWGISYSERWADNVWKLRTYLWAWQLWGMALPPQALKYWTIITLHIFFGHHIFH